MPEESTEQPQPTPKDAEQILAALAARATNSEGEQNDRLDAIVALMVLRQKASDALIAPGGEVNVDAMDTDFKIGDVLSGIRTSEKDLPGRDLVPRALVLKFGKKPSGSGIPSTPPPAAPIQ